MRNDFWFRRAVFFSLLAAGGWMYVYFLVKGHDFRFVEKEDSIRSMAAKLAVVTLEKLPGVSVIFDSLDPRIGLEEGDLRARVTERLDAAGVPTVSVGESIERDLPVLYIYISTAVDEGGHILVSNVSSELLSPMIMYLPPNYPVYNRSWNSLERIFVSTNVGSNKITSVILDDVDSCVDEFINAYLTTNSTDLK